MSRVEFSPGDLVYLHQHEPPCWALVLAYDGRANTPRWAWYLVLVPHCSKLLALLLSPHHERMRFPPSLPPGKV